VKRNLIHSGWSQWWWAVFTGAGFGPRDLLRAWSRSHCSAAALQFSTRLFIKVN